MPPSAFLSNGKKTCSTWSTNENLYLWYQDSERVSTTSIISTKRSLNKTESACLIGCLYSHDTHVYTWMHTHQSAETHVYTFSISIPTSIASTTTTNTQTHRQRAIDTLTWPYPGCNELNACSFVLRDTCNKASIPSVGATPAAIAAATSPPPLTPVRGGYLSTSGFLETDADGNTKSFRSKHSATPM